MIILLFVLIIVITGIIKKVNIYESLLNGVENSFKVIIKIIPIIITISFIIDLFIKSNIISNIFKIISYPLKNYKNYDFKLNSLIFTQMFLKPVSYNSSFIVMNNIFNTYGINSKIALFSSLIQGSSDTTIYVVTLYFSYIGVKNSTMALKLGLLGDIITFLLITTLFLILKF